MTFRGAVLAAALAVLAVHACTLDFGQYRGETTGAGGTATGAGGSTTSTGGAGGAGVGGAGVGGAGVGGSAVGGAGGAGGGLSDLGTTCDSSADCDVGECCTDNACEGTCMVPCNNSSDCPLDTMRCVHDYCLFPCQVDTDCEHADFVCHHNCEWCEKKASQGCN